MDEMKEKPSEIEKIDGKGKTGYRALIDAVAKNLELPVDKIAENDPKILEKAKRSETKPIASDIDFWVNSVTPKKNPTPIEAEIKSGDHVNMRRTSVEFTDETSYKDTKGLVPKIVLAQAVLEKVAKESPYPSIRVKAENGAEKLQKQALKYIESPREVNLPKSLFEPTSSGKKKGIFGIGVASLALAACGQTAEVAPTPEIKPTEAVSIPTPEAPIFAPTVAPSTSEALSSIPLTTSELANVSKVTWYEFASTPDSEPGYKLQQVIEENKEALGINGEITANTFFSFSAEGSTDPIGLYGLVFWKDGETDKATFVYGRDPNNRFDSGTINSKRLEIYGQNTVGYAEKQDDGSTVRYLSLDYGDGGVSPVLMAEKNGTLNWVFDTANREIPFATVEEFDEKTGGKLALIVPEIKEPKGHLFVPELTIYNPESGQMETITGRVIEESEYWDGEISQSYILSVDDRVPLSSPNLPGLHETALIRKGVLRQTRVVEFTLADGTKTEDLYADFGIKDTDGKEITMRVRFFDYKNSRYSEGIRPIIEEQLLGKPYSFYMAYSRYGSSHTTEILNNRISGIPLPFCYTKEACRIAIGQMGDIKSSLEKIKEIFSDAKDGELVDFSNYTFITTVHQK